MAKDKSKHGGGDEGAGDRIPAALREFGQRAAELAQNPVARSVIAAGLVTAAAALTANQKVRDTSKKTARDSPSHGPHPSRHARRREHARDHPGVHERDADRGGRQGPQRATGDR